MEKTKMPMTATQAQQLYVAYFNRPADTLGLAYWMTKDAAAASAAFAASTEYAATYAGMSTAARVDAIYTNLFGRPSEPDGLKFWGGLIESGKITVSDAVTAIAKGAQGTDLTAYNNKVKAAEAFTTALDTSAEIVAYSGTAANAAAKTWLSGITTDATLTTATATTALNASIAGVTTVGAPVPPVVPSVQFALTKTVDNFVGTAGNDTVSGTLAPAANEPTFNVFDSLSGGAGTDTLNIVSTTATNFALPASFTASGFEVVNISHAASGGAGTGVVSLNNKAINTGITALSYIDAGAAADMTAATVAITLESAASISAKAVGAGTFTTVAITDKGVGAIERGSVLNTVTVQKAAGAVTLEGNAINTVNLSAAAALTTVNANAGTRDLTVNASGTTTQGGLTDAEATSATLNFTGGQAFGTLTVAKAASVAINTNATAASTVTLAAAKATSLTLDGKSANTVTVTGADPVTSLVVKGSGGVTVDVSGMNSLTSVDTSASTAAAPATGTVTTANVITIGTGVTYTGGAGQDVISVGATTKSVAAGAENDTVTITSTSIGTGGSVSGGEGTDILKVSQANADTIDGGTDAQTAAWRAAVTGFETLDIGTIGVGVTVAVNKLGTFSTIALTGAAQTATFSGVTSGTTIQANVGAAGITGITLNSLTGSADVITANLKGDLSAAAQGFGNFTTPGVETVNIKLEDTNATFTARLATITVVDANAENIVVSGNNGLALTHAGTNLFNLDASGLTKGAITFTSGALTTDTTVKGSVSGGDTLNFGAAVAKVNITATAGTNVLTGSGTVASTITGGTGADTIVGSSKGDTISVGAGNTGNTITAGGGQDKIDLSGSTGSDVVRYATIATSAAADGAQMDTITAFRAGVDKIGFAGDALSLTGVTFDLTDAFAALGAVIDVSTSVADTVAVYTALAAQVALTASAADGTATVAQVYNFTTGAAAGTYLVVNNAAAGFQATDAVIRLVGLEGTMTAADFVTF